jgi:hypothetical protein
VRPETFEAARHTNVNVEVTQELTNRVDESMMEVKGLIDNARADRM